MIFGGKTLLYEFFVSKRPYTYKDTYKSQKSPAGKKIHTYIKKSLHINIHIHISKKPYT